MRNGTSGCARHRVRPRYYSGRCATTLSRSSLAAKITKIIPPHDSRQTFLSSEAEISSAERRTDLFILSLIRFVEDARATGWGFCVIQAYLSASRPVLSGLSQINEWHFNIAPGQISGRCCYQDRQSCQHDGPR